MKYLGFFLKQKSTSAYSINEQINMDSNNSNLFSFTSLKRPPPEKLSSSLLLKSILFPFGYTGCVYRLTVSLVFIMFHYIHVFMDFCKYISNRSELPLGKKVFKHSCNTHDYFFIFLPCFFYYYRKMLVNSSQVKCVTVAVTSGTVTPSSK